MANRLINEQSPYLLQHAQNPVEWYPWGDEAFERARTEHKPVLVSIGYAACHWCHVMEHESFEHEETAAYMNAHFVCIKVDREEHPDVDHLYMDAVQALGGSGGWPLNVFVTPERAPFYGGTYYPPRPAYNRPSWMQLLQRMAEIWEQKQDDVAMQAEQMIAHLQQASQRQLSGAAKPGEDICKGITDNLMKMADKEQGGFGNAPKFPGTMAISYLLEYYHYNGDEAALQHALLSLDAMCRGGIYDQLAGGFARYSTDREWLAPHFEKMLYDNALLVSALCDAYSITHAERHKTTIEETIAFAERELKDTTGGYYCALDADSEGEEGKYYTWTWDEWKAALGFEDEDESRAAQVAAAYFGVRREGNWEGTNILHIANEMSELATEYQLPEAEIRKIIDDAKHKLLKVRSKRIRPLTDDKSLLSWNALMNISLTKAGVVLDNAGYLARASEHMKWMLEQFDSEGLKHVWKNGRAKIAAKLDDYAYLVQALLQLASATGEAAWLPRAAELSETVVKEFSQGDGYFYYTAASQQDIPVRKVDLYDGATPSANAVMAHSLWVLGVCMERGEWVARAVKMMEQTGDIVLRYSYSFGYWALLLQRHLRGMKTVVCSGSGAEQCRRGIQAAYAPECFVLTSAKKISDLQAIEKKYSAGEMRIFVCTAAACLSPAGSVEEVLRLLKQEPADRYN